MLLNLGKERVVIRRSNVTGDRDVKPSGQTMFVLHQRLYRFELIPIPVSHVTVTPIHDPIMCRHTAFARNTFHKPLERNGTLVLTLIGTTVSDHCRLPQAPALIHRSMLVGKLAPLKEHHVGKQ